MELYQGVITADSASHYHTKKWTKKIGWCCPLKAIRFLTVPPAVGPTHTHHRSTKSASFSKTTPKAVSLLSYFVFCHFGIISQETQPVVLLQEAREEQTGHILVPPVTRTTQNQFRFSRVTIAYHNNQIKCVPLDGVDSPCRACSRRSCPCIFSTKRKPGPKRQEKNNNPPPVAPTSVTTTSPSPGNAVARTDMGELSARHRPPSTARGNVVPRVSSLVLVKAKPATVPVVTAGIA